jgi:hypothetical protein
MWILDKIKAISDLLFHDDALRAFAEKPVTILGCFPMIIWLPGPRMCDLRAVNSRLAWKTLVPMT